MIGGLATAFVLKLLLFSVIFYVFNRFHIYRSQSVPASDPS